MTSRDERCTLQSDQQPQLLRSLFGLSGKIGILGGTFDPVHNGHILAAETARLKLGLEHVILLPTQQNPLKLRQPGAPDNCRLEMLLAAVKNYPQILVSDAELLGELPSFTVEMLKEVRKQGMATLDLYFIVGADNLCDLPGWKNADQIQNYAKLCAISRPGIDLAKCFATLKGVLPPNQLEALRDCTVEAVVTPISSTTIRNRLAAGMAIDELVPANVEAIITKKKLYRSAPVNSDLSLTNAPLPNAVPGLGTGSDTIRSVAKSANEITQQITDSQQTFKIAISQRKYRPTRFEHNFKLICNDIDQAEKERVARLIFPESTIPGYLSLDMLKNPAYIDENLKVLRKVIEYSCGKKLTIIIGFVDRGPDRGNGRPNLYNAAAVIQNGQLLDTIRKVLLPEGDIFWEQRYYSSGEDVHVTRIADTTEGIFICEDLWDENYERRIAAELKNLGAERLYNISASPFHVGKAETRYRLLQGKAQTLGVDLIYANLVGTQDGYQGEVLFDGRSMIFNRNGQMIGMGKTFEEELLIVDLHTPIALELPQLQRVDEIHDALVMGFQDYFERFNLKNALIGISGGLDSAVVAALACEALGPNRVRGLTMPMQNVTSSDTYNDTWQLATNLGFELQEAPISKIFRSKEDALRKVYGASTGWRRRVRDFASRLGFVSPEADPISSLTKENLQSRTRGELLMALSNNHPGDVVICPGNETEFWNFTLYGDSVGAVKPLGNLDKSTVFSLGYAINQRLGREAIPRSILERVPTAELMAGQIDTDILPADYQIMSPLIRETLIPERSRAELLTMFRPLLGDRCEEVVDITISRIRGNNGGFGKEWAHRQTPPGFRVTEHAIGAGRRIPYDNQFGG